MLLIRVPKRKTMRRLGGLLRYYHQEAA